MIEDCQLNAHNFAVMAQRQPARYGALRFDPNDTCNLHCVYCHNTRSTWSVDLEALRDFLAVKVLGVDYFQVGCVMEPTLDKRLAEIIELIGGSPARPGHTFILQTNGLLLHRHDHARMAAAGLTNLSVSLDVADADLQRVLRGGMSIAKLLRNVAGFRAAVPQIAIEFIAVMTSANVAQAEQLAALAIDAGAQRLIFRELLYYPESTIVEHARMAALLLMPGEFEAMTARLRERYEGRIDMVFAPNTELHDSVIRMIENSNRKVHELSPTLHRAPSSR